jgi:hypothetical protein
LRVTRSQFGSHFAATDDQFRLQIAAHPPGIDDDASPI